MINERGIWLDKSETDIHTFDEPLCAEIIKGIDREFTVVDIGCGNGAYTMAIRDAGISCAGYDGSPLTEEITNGVCRIMDFSEPVHIGKFDLVLSLEVGEHIPAQYEHNFINNITKTARRFIILSWAVEGQPGFGHVNCRNNDYVIEKMRSKGFLYCEESTYQLRLASTLPWFKATVMIFERTLI